MISSEKELEDYICNNQEDFINALKNIIYGEDCDIKFIGRQVKIGENNIADLVYYYDYLETIINPKNNKEFTVSHREFIIVELKYRYLEPRDLNQIQRYINVLNEKICHEEQYFDYDNHISGVFVSFGTDKNMQEIVLAQNIEDIYYLTIKDNLSYESDNIVYNDKYIKDLKLDDRIDKIYK